MKKRLWAALAANVCLWSACSSGDQPLIPDANPTPPVAPPPAPHAAREHEIRGGRMHDVMINGIADPARIDAARLVGAVQADLRGRLGALQATDFVEIHREVSAPKAGARLQFVTLRQTVGGVPIDDTYLYIAIRSDARGAKLVSSSYRLYEQMTVDTTPAIPRERAVILAQQGLRLRAPVAPLAAQLVVHKLGGHLQLAWSLRFPGTHLRSFVVASGAERGRTYAIDDRVFETTGTATATIVRNGAPGAAGVVETDALAHAVITGGGAEATANAAGGYAITVPGGTPLTVTPSGKASIVFDQQGATLSTTSPAQDGGITNLPLASTTENGLAQLTSYVVVDQVRGFLEAHGMDPALFGAPLPTNTNENDTCNAFFDPGARDINFFRSGGGCNNSSIDTVIAHEYGHFVDDFNGGILDGGLSEGWGDLLACLWSKQPLLGFDLFPGVALRNCQNDYVFPPGGDEVHNLGQAWAGFGWDVRTNLIAALGPSGDELANALILPSFQSNSPDIPTSVREVFLRDDDDGDLSNHTPHWDQLIAAAAHHGLTFAVEGDFTPPAPVTDLALANPQPTQVTAQWTATGDDGATGTAASYQLRWAPFPIDASNFFAANLVPTGAPKPAGAAESVTISVPPSTPIFVALVVFDEQLNESTLSNVATATTPGGTPVFEENVEGDTTAWTATGLWHVTTRRASEGTHAFWYGQEDTGNYNTGGANSGDLTSPVIDLTAVGNPVLAFDEFINSEPDPFDLAQVIITDVDDPTHTLLLQKDTSFSAAFGTRVIALTGFDAKRIQLRFHFDTIDGVANNFEGFYVDHLQIFGSPLSTCAHDLCVSGGALDPACSECAAEVCATDAFCCQIAWDNFCVLESQQICGTTCTTCGNGVCEPGESQASCPQDCTPPACAHGVCDPGVPLDQACDTCAGTVCGSDPFCCTVFWDRICVQESESLCGEVCEGCAHDFCNVGDPLASNCDACATSVCAADPFCCTNAWDSRCVQEAANGCGLACQVCSHSLCDQGTALETGCDACVTAVCAADAYCCNNTWDQRCVDDAQTTCGLQCQTFR